MSAMVLGMPVFGGALVQPRASRASRRLRGDTRGAVMVVGLLFACFLASALWYVIGVGDAIVYRDRMQEAADAVSFSAAVVHARGMNFIVLCNLLMFVLTAFYTVIAIITDIAQTVQLFVGLPSGYQCPSNPCTFSEQVETCPAVADVTDGLGFLWCGGSATIGSCSAGGLLSFDPMSPCAVGSLIPILGEAVAAGCCTAAAFDEPIVDAVADSLFPTYFDFIQGFMPNLATLEHVTAQWIAPWGAEAVAVQTAAQYGQTGAMLSLSLIPDQALGNLAGLGQSPEPTATTAQTDPAYQFSLQKVGLPVQQLRMRALCGKAFVYPIQWIIDELNLGPISGILTVLNDAIGNAFADHYCDRDIHGQEEVNGEEFWRSPGPMDIYSPAANGSDWMQVWGFIILASKTDTERTIVGLASHKPSVAVNLTGTPVPQWYSAEAEFYFDCHGNFPDDSCNGQGSGWNAAGGYSMYVPHWRARLRRVHKPSFFSDLINVGISGLFTADNSTAIGNGVKSVLSPITQDMGGLGTFALDQASQMAVGEVGTLVTNAGTEIGTQIDGNGVINTTIH